jgi:O-antigen ligase
MPVLTLAILALALAYAAFQRAGVTPDWNWSLCVIGAACGLYYLTSLRNPPPRPGKLTVALLTALVGLAILQMVPLPTSLVAAISPARAELVRGTAIAFGSAPRWTTLSVAPWQTLGYVLRLAAYALVLLVIREITIGFQGGSNCWAPVWPLIFIAAAEGVLGFAQISGGNTDGFARGTYTNQDHYAGLLELVLPFAAVYPFAILYRDRDRHRSPGLPAIKACVPLACAIIILIGILLSLSRGAFLASLAALIVAGALGIGLRDARIEPSVKISAWRKWMPSVLVAVVILLGFVFLPSDPLISRFSELANNEGISADTRARIWHDSVELVKAFPWVGCGFGGYGSAFLRYKTVVPMLSVDYAHNDYLQVLAESGVAGFAIGFVLLLLILRAALRGAIYARSLDDRLLSIACIASFTAILLHSFVDFNMYVPANGLTVAWIAGIAAVRLVARRKTPIARIQTNSSSPEARPAPASSLSARR